MLGGWLCLLNTKASIHDKLGISIKHKSVWRPSQVYGNPYTNADRVCVHCKDEKHFLLKCDISAFERQCFYEKMSRSFDEFLYLNDDEKVLFVLASVNSQYLSWLGEFLYKSFEKRNEFAICRQLVEAEWRIYAPLS